MPPVVRITAILKGWARVILNAVSSVGRRSSSFAQWLRSVGLGPHLRVVTFSVIRPLRLSTSTVLKGLRPMVAEPCMDPGTPPSEDCMLSTPIEFGELDNNLHHDSVQTI
jgi:hypothetical protein